MESMFPGVDAAEGEGSDRPEDDPREERYLSRGEAAHRLGVTPRTIQQWAKDGKIPFIRTFGGHRRFLVRDLDAMGEMERTRGRRRADPQAPP